MFDEIMPHFLPVRNHCFWKILIYHKYFEFYIIKIGELNILSAFVSKVHQVRILILDLCMSIN